MGVFLDFSGESGEDAGHVDQLSRSLPDFRALRLIRTGAIYDSSDGLLIVSSRAVFSIA